MQGVFIQSVLRCGRDDCQFVRNGDVRLAELHYERKHSALDKRTPAAVFMDGVLNK